jgi:3-phosphoshikimate 1-carboxyvinyltransferase
MDFYANPDLAQTIITTTAGLQISGEFTGLSNLRLKETDRINALVNELSALGAIISDEKDNIKLSSGKLEAKRKVRVYSDHRMAMSFAPLSMLLGKIKIDSPTVVAKSYPKFWDDMKSVGFNIKNV